MPRYACFGLIKFVGSTQPKYIESTSQSVQIVESTQPESVPFDSDANPQYIKLDDITTGSTVEVTTPITFMDSGGDEACSDDENYRINF